jgi:hypothetical protein
MLRRTLGGGLGECKYALACRTANGHGERNLLILVCITRCSRILERVRNCGRGGNAKVIAIISTYLENCDERDMEGVAVQNTECMPE